jgi:hypothetical protein
MLFSLALSAAAGDNLFPPADYIHSKLQQNDIVFLGTTHKKPEILGFIAELIPTLEKYGVSHVGLEIPSDQQEKIDVFMKTGTVWMTSSSTLRSIVQNTGTCSKCFETPVGQFRWRSIYPVPCTMGMFPVMNGWHGHC